MTYTICVITGTRAEFGLLFPLISRIRDHSGTELQLVVTGSHLNPKFGYTVDEIRASGIPVDCEVPIDLDGDTKADMAYSTGLALCAFARYFEKNRPDMAVVLGDRFEIFAASAAAAMEGIPVAHIHGGETTEGAVDEFLRHSITKMSILHFSACEEYRQRVIQLGESPDRVFNYGALGVENILHSTLTSLHDLSDDLGFDLVSDPYAIVTVHSVTQENDSSEQLIRNVIRAMDSFPEMKYIITKANADAGGRTINRIWDEEAETHKNWKVVTSLGMKRYLSALKYASMMVGNSSSGIIEAPAFHIPAVNIGDRQKGRLMAESVISCDADENSIREAMKKAASDEFREIARNAVSLFGDGNTSEKIITTIIDYLNSGNVTNKKTFYDIRIIGDKQQ